LSRPLVALLEALELDERDELDELDFGVAFLALAFAVDFFGAAFLALALVFDFVDLAAFDAFDFELDLLPVDFPLAFFSAI
jgi:hypothetical protein